MGASSFVRGLTVAATVWALVGSAPATARAQGGPTPAQWLAKMNTEGTGTAPVASGWPWGVGYFNALGCNASSLQLLGSAVYKSPAFLALGYDDASRVLALVRGAYNREVTQSELNFVLAVLNMGITWDTVADAIFAAGPATALFPSICSTTNPDYGFGTTPAGDVRAWLGLGPSRSQADLQQDLDDAVSTCGVVPLEPHEVVFVGADEPLRVPACVTLETGGLPPVAAYARMGRLVAAADACDGWNCHGRGLVELGDGATLRNVWLDARAATDGDRGVALVNVASGSATTTVEDCKISDPPAGGSAIRLEGWSVSQIECSNRVVTGNLITGYGRPDDQTGLGAPLWANGIVVHCEDALVESNALVDVAGTGISLKGSWNAAVGNTGVDGSRAQTSIVRENTLISAGVNGLVGLEADPAGQCLAEDDGAPVACLEFGQARDDMPTLDPVRSFFGAAFEDNSIWTGPSTHFDVGILIGGVSRLGTNTPVARGMSIIGNDTAGLTARVQTGILVSGMLDTTLAGNVTSGMTIVSAGSHWGGGCASGAVVAGFMLANFLPGYDPFTFAAPASTTACLIPTPPSGGREAIAVEDGALVGAVSGRRYVPWGHNHALDHHETRADLLLLRHMGSNVVRIHPQFRDFVDASCQIKASALTELAALADSAGEIGIYLDVTGLGSYAGDPSDPACYRNATQAERWGYHVAFWTAVATELEDHPAVLMFDLMNEPNSLMWESPGATCWTGDPAYTTDPRPQGCAAGLGGYYFTQNLIRDPELDSGDVAQSWLDQVTGAIRGVDADRLLTVGCMHYEDCVLGLTPTELADVLDVLSIHIYPEDCTPEANPGTPCSPFVGGPETTAVPLEWERGLVTSFAAAGKPVIVEEILTIESTSLVKQFITEETATGVVDGWIGQWQEDTTLSSQRVSVNPYYPVPVPLQYPWYDWGRIFQGLTHEIAPCGGCSGGAQ